ncbi:MAG TPA: 50S ribosomal protein L4 [Candidatus Nanoarchaeia archaeon]|nr:50S ribosomal protein L4 [Candidatus Nanoarchaeia archaeon]
MNADVLDLSGKKIKNIELPKQFEEEYRPGLIRRAVRVIFMNNIQKYGAKLGAGMRQSAKISRRRRNYKGSYGHGISRVPRKSLWSRGTQFGWVGAVSPGTVGGRNAHPPKAKKNWGIKINKKEKRKAIRSAIGASTKNMLVFEDKIEDLSKTKEVNSLFNKVALEKEIYRLKEKNIRSGKGKSRGRKYNKKIGPLFVVSKKCSLQQSLKNIHGCDVMVVKDINTALLTRGNEPRRVIWSEEAIAILEKEKLFMEKKNV